MTRNFNLETVVSKACFMCGKQIFVRDRVWYDDPHFTTRHVDKKLSFVEPLDAKLERIEATQREILKLLIRIVPK